MSSRAPKARAAEAAPAPAPAAPVAPAHGAAAHWGLERAVSAAAFALLIWLAISLWRLPGLDQPMVAQWLKSPLAAVPMLLLVVVLFQHIRMGLAQVVEDYVHEPVNRMLCLALINGAAILIGALALLSLLKIVLGPATGGGPPHP